MSEPGPGGGALRRPRHTRPAIAARCVAAAVWLAGSVPPWGWWPLTFISFALVSRQLDEPARRVRAKRGAVFALGWFGPSVFWMIDFTLPGYGVVLALWGGFWALAAVACPPGRRRWPALVGATVLAEFLRWSWPFGGQPLATVAGSRACLSSSSALSAVRRAMTA